MHSLSSHMVCPSPAELHPKMASLCVPLCLTVLSVPPVDNPVKCRMDTKLGQHDYYLLGWQLLILSPRQERERNVCLVCAEILLEWENALTLPGASQVVLVVKNLAANVGDVRDAGSIPGSR